jgi:hypothetical protein
MQARLGSKCLCRDPIPDYIMLSAVSSNAYGYYQISVVYISSFLLCQCFLSNQLFGISLIITPTTKEVAPKKSDIAHCFASSLTVDSALPPKLTMRTWPATVIKLMPIKYQLRCRPEKMLKWRSSRRLLCLISKSGLAGLRKKQKGGRAFEWRYELILVEELHPHIAIENHCFES